MYSNELKKVIFLFLKKLRTKKPNVYLFFLFLVKQKNTLASKIFDEIYPDSNSILINFETLMNQLEKEKEEPYKSLNYGFNFTPILEKLLYKVCIKRKKDIVSKKNIVITTQDIFFALIELKQVKDLLNLANRNAQD